MGETIALPEIQIAFWGAIAVLIIGVVLLYTLSRQYSDRQRANNYAGAFISATVMIAVAVASVLAHMGRDSGSCATAIEEGVELDLWANILTLSVGFLLLGIAWLLWDGASERSNATMIWRLGAAAMLLVGGWFLIGELPVAIAAGDHRWWLGVINTFWYSLGAIPAQLAAALVLAVLLFQYQGQVDLPHDLLFIPYIAPFVGTAAVFRILFSSRPSTPLNTLVDAIGADPLKWLSKPTGIFQLLLGNSVTLPESIAGPSLSLIVIMVYGVWTFTGFNTVIFMAGLG